MRADDRQKHENSVARDRGARAWSCPEIEEQAGDEFDIHRDDEDDAEAQEVCARRFCPAPAG